MSTNLDYPYIIGISGISGAGKSTLASALEKELNATLIAWDDFDNISTGPDDYVDWYNRGEDYTEWDYSYLENVLQNLKLGNNIIHPALRKPLQAKHYIVFDAPLGRFHQQTGKYIDRWIHISVPLDISLARRIIRDFSSDRKTKEDILDDLNHYIASSRPLFLDDQYKEQADYIIDGMLLINIQVQNIVEFIHGDKNE